MGLILKRMVNVIRFVMVMMLLRMGVYVNGLKIFCVFSILLIKLYRV